MRFEWVHAEAFGPLEDQLLRFSPGLNVVTGGNEAGKSSWHAAIYVALCGMRRARGRLSLTDERFAARHAPWDGGPWQVRALVTLADGRRVELEQDLKGRVACRAVDADLGRDYSSEIMGDGAPDGSRWLGLDRRVFMATACVRQADLLGCLREPRLLQEHLQAVAATAGADGTAAAALERLERCRSERVGLDRSSSVKPLATAKRRLADAEAALQRVRTERVEFLRLAEQIQREAEAEAEARHRLALVEAVQTGVTAREVRHRFRRAQALAGEADVEIRPPRGPAGLVAAAALGLLGVALLVAGPPLMGGVALVLGLAAAGSLLRSGDRQQFSLQQSELLQALLRGRTLDELRADAERREADAERLRGGLAREELARVGLEADTAVQRRRLAHAVQEASDAVAFTRGRLERDSRILHEVPEAEEEFAAARAELARVERLSATLDTTERFLRAAQERVHRDIAPVLAGAIGRLLPEVTLGRYREARVDPASLELQVREVSGRWRQAALLSHGTAEQLYLLLRVALAQHLTKAGEVCPLLLDDVTVQSDAQRTLAILRALVLVSRERQVILLSQEEQVHGWAQANLGPRDQLIELDAPVPQPV
ncbi:MAG: AAA family ATPase [Nitriliruptorales bacterium]|nr:AAA family ATPase [Nitriliruptorales bacterium]